MVALGLGNLGRLTMWQAPHANLPDGFAWFRGRGVRALGAVDALTQHMEALRAPGAGMVAANINPSTGLASDYLNHFNEITMLIGLVADVPDMLNDIRAWRPASYEAHFERSGFTAKALAIETYRACDPGVRRALVKAVTELDAAVTSVIAELLSSPPTAWRAIAEEGEALIQPLMGRASGVIHGVVFDEHAAPGASQSAIDELLG